MFSFAALVYMPGISPSKSRAVGRRPQISAHPSGSLQPCGQHRLLSGLRHPKFLSIVHVVHMAEAARHEELVEVEVALIALAGPSSYNTKPKSPQQE